MKVLVTGGHGFIGAVLEKDLKHAGYMIRMFDLVDGTGDVLDEPQFGAAIIESDVIVHLAGIVGYPACEADPELARATNIGSIRTLAKYAEDRLIINSSTQSVYGATEDICTEETPVYPLSLYAETKLAAEVLLWTEGTRAISLRFGTGFGVSPSWRDDLLINDFVRTALEIGRLDVYQPEARRSFIHVTDMSKAIMFAIEKHELLLACGGPFNVGDEEMNLTKQDIAEAVAELTGCELGVMSGVDTEKRDYFVSYEKLHAVGFSTMVRLQEGLVPLIEESGRRLVRLETIQP